MNLRLNCKRGPEFQGSCSIAGTVEYLFGMKSLWRALPLVSGLEEEHLQATDKYRFFVARTQGEV